MKITMMKIKYKYKLLKTKRDILLHWLAKPAEGSELALQYLTILGTALSIFIIAIMLLVVTQII